MPTYVPQFLSRKSIAAMFDTSVPTVRRWQERGVIPQPKNIGGLERWEVGELLNHIGVMLTRQAGGRAGFADPDEALRDYEERVRREREERAERRRARQ